MSKRGPYKVKSLEDRLRAQVFVLDDCWLWQGYVSPDTGYGSIGVNGRTRRVHRVAYEVFVGPIPDGCDLNHTCEHRSCINVGHLEPTTNAKNLALGQGPYLTRRADAVEDAPKGGFLTPKVGLLLVGLSHRASYTTIFFSDGNC